ncbi:TPA: hypothetical protein ACODA1_000795 [Neisseria meningitidis]
MAVIIFVNGIRAVNGLVKSSINTANAFAEEGLDVHLINFVGNITGAEHLSPPFHLHPNVKTSSIIDLFAAEIFLFILSINNSSKPNTVPTISMF